MATLHEYFKKDFSNTLRFEKTVSVKSSKDGTSVDVQVKECVDFDASSRFFSFYVPAYPSPVPIFLKLISELDKLVAIGKDVLVASMTPGEMQVSDGQAYIFTHRIFFYFEGNCSEGEIRELTSIMKGKGLSLVIRGMEYLNERVKVEKPLAFICHDSRDKNEIAGKIAEGLSKMFCPVWYDEYSLKVGDKLRESIEKGLKECKKCILILTKNFLTNPGWTKAEFNSIFTRELLENKNLVLPIWCGVSKEEVFEYSPSLLDRVGLNWDLGADEINRKLFRVINS